MQKHRVHFSVIRIYTGEKVAYRDSIATSQGAAFTQVIDYVEQNWGPMESDEDGIDLFTWDCEREECIDTDLKDGIYH